jgi:sec-independent protein translocase protein TatC
MTKGRSHKGTGQPTMLVHHVREIQIRLLAIASVLIAGMIVGYVYYEPLFEFIKAPLNAPLHYMSPAGSFTLIIKICLMIGVIVALPVAVYNAIMFIQPALEKRLSRARVYLTTLASLLLAGGGAAFGFLIILPLALHFFYKFQVSGLVAIISADEYLQFVVSIIVTFALIFQLPLLISLIDHITPLPPKKLLKIEKYIIVGSIFIGVVVPFALDPTVQLLIASPIIILYNLSIVIVLLQHAARKRRHAKSEKRVSEPAGLKSEASMPVAPYVLSQGLVNSLTSPSPARPQPVTSQSVTKQVVRPKSMSLDGTRRLPAVKQMQTVQDVTRRTQLGRIPAPMTQGQSPSSAKRLITDVRMTQARSRITPPARAMSPLVRRQIIE